MGVRGFRDGPEFGPLKPTGSLSDLQYEIILYFYKHVMFNNGIDVPFVQIYVSVSMFS